MDIQYVHQAQYGNAGGTHLARPQYMIKGDSVYATPWNKIAPTEKAIYNIRDGKWFATENHPDGKNFLATYEMHGDKIHTTSFHPEHNASQHVFEIRSETRPIV